MIHIATYLQYQAIEGAQCHHLPKIEVLNDGINQPSKPSDQYSKPPKAAATYRLQHQLKARHQRLKEVLRSWPSHERKRKKQTWRRRQSLVTWFFWTTGTTLPCMEWCHNIIVPCAQPTSETSTSTPPKSNTTMEHPPFENVLPIENEIFHCHVSFQRCIIFEQHWWAIGTLLIQNHRLIAINGPCLWQKQVIIYRSWPNGHELAATHILSCWKRKFQRFTSEICIWTSHHNFRTRHSFLFS